MSLQENTKNIKYFKEYLNLALLGGVVVLSFILGCLSVILNIENYPVVIRSAFKSELVSKNDDKNIVASRNGSKYYYSWCSGVSRLSEKNKVFFNTAKEAIDSGYEKAKNCPGE